MGKKAVFLDRDGTIIVDYGYTYQVEQLEFIEGSISALKLLQKKGYLLIVVTNQSGVARGYFTEEELANFHSYMVRKLKQNGVTIDAIYYCPHLEGCNCRKPKLALFYQAQKDFDIDFSESFAIGDKLRDLSLCEAEPVEGFLLSTNEDIIKNDRIRVCKNLLEAAEFIIDNGD